MAVLRKRNLKVSHLQISCMPCISCLTARQGTRMIVPARMWPFVSFLWLRLDNLKLQWRHNERDGISNHQRLDCLLNRLFRHKPKKTSKFHITGLVRGIHRWPVNFPNKGQQRGKCFHLMTSSWSFLHWDNWLRWIAYHHWWHWRLSYRQPSMPPMMISYSPWCAFCSIAK